MDHLTHPPSSPHFTLVITPSIITHARTSTYTHAHTHEQTHIEELTYRKESRADDAGGDLTNADSDLARKGTSSPLMVKVHFT